MAKVVREYCNDCSFLNFEHLNPEFSGHSSPFCDFLEKPSFFKNKFVFISVSYVCFSIFLTQFNLFPFHYTQSNSDLTKYSMYHVIQEVFKNQFGSVTSLRYFLINTLPHILESNNNNISSVLQNRTVYNFLIAWVNQDGSVHLVSLLDKLDKLDTFTKSECSWFVNKLQGDFSFNDFKNYNISENSLRNFFDCIKRSKMRG